MPVRSLKKYPVYTWIPPGLSAKYKVTVTRADGTVDDISAKLHFFEVEDETTDAIGRFEIQLYDPAQAYTTKWTGMEVVRYYKDYAATATTLRFRGRVERVSYTNNMLKVTGRSEGLLVFDKTVTKSYTDTETSLILRDLISSYASGLFTVNNVSLSTTTLSVNWIQKPFWDCVKELCTASGFDCYVDKDADMNYFQQGSRLNTDEGIVHDYNLIDIDEFADDLTQVRNRIIVYGATVDGVQVLYTAEDSVSQTAYGVREQIINDDNIIDYDNAKAIGDYYLSVNKDPPQIGECTALGLLASIQPGQSIRLSSPTDNIPPDAYLTTSYVDTIDLLNGVFNTTVRLVKGPTTTSDVLKTVIENNTRKQDTSANPYEMRYSYVFTFDTDTGTHYGTSISSGVLKGVGAWISPTRILPDNLTEAYLLVKGETLTGCQIAVSGNGNVTFQNINDKERVYITTATGTSLSIRITITNIDTQVDSVSLLYKVT
jgi:hypothetical protein